MTKSKEKNLEAKILMVEYYLGLISAKRLEEELNKLGLIKKSVSEKNGYFLKEGLKELIESYVKQYGIRMSRDDSHTCGLFIIHDTDKKTVYSLEEIDILLDKGFSIDQDMGLFVWNAILRT